MKENLDRSLMYILSDEGGFAIRDAEPGGAVNKGISLATLHEYWDRHKLGIPTIEDLRNLTTEQAKYIYKDRYAVRIAFDDLPSGVDYVMLNAAVMEGVTGARQLWERAHTPNARDTAYGIIILQLARKMHRESVSKFGVGWSDRLIRVWDRAKEML